MSDDDVAKGRQLSAWWGGKVDDLLADRADMLKVNRAYFDLMAIIFRDGGHRREAIGDDVAAGKAAIDAVCVERRELAELRAENAALVAEAARMREAKDGAYEERNRVVALAARMAIQVGYQSGITKTAIEGWSDDWHGCVYLDLPSGQVSWHFHDSQAHLFADLPEYHRNWDGHDTPEKYRRVAKAFRDEPPNDDENDKAL